MCCPETRAINLKPMPRHSAVQALLEDLVERDGERGLQATAYLDGQLVLETWSGLADQPMETRCGKGVVATDIHLLAERCHQLRTVVCGTSSCFATECRPSSLVTFRLTAELMTATTSRRRATSKLAAPVVARARAQSQRQSDQHEPDVSAIDQALLRCGASRDAGAKVDEGRRRKRRADEAHVPTTSLRSSR